MSDQEKQVQTEFAEAQLQASSNDTVDFPYQVDNLNQEDVFNHFQAQGFDREDAESRTQGTDFQEQVRFENIEAGDEFSRHRESQANDETYTSIHPTGSYLAQPDANPEQLGIPSKETYNVTESFQATEDTTALVSTANDIESWNEPGTIYSGGETQYYVSTEDLDNFQKTGQSYADEFQTSSTQIDNHNNYSTDNTLKSMNTEFPGPGQQPEPNPATIETPNDESSSNEDSDDKSLDDLVMPPVEVSNPNWDDTPTPPPIPTPSESSSWSSEDIDAFSSTPESSSWSSEDIDTSFSVDTSANEASPSDAADASSAADGDSV